MTIEQVKENIYEHITLEHGMGLPPHESWEGINVGEEWVDESIENGFNLDDLRGKIFDEVYEQWSKENDVDEDELEED